jgi:hypothetical protein
VTNAWGAGVASGLIEEGVVLDETAISIAAALSARADNIEDSELEVLLASLYKLINERLQHDASGKKALDDVVMYPRDARGMAELSAELSRVMAADPSFAEKLGQGWGPHIIGSGMKFR